MKNTQNCDTSISCCVGWILSPWKRICWNLKPPVPQNEIIFRNRVFEWAFIQNDCCFTKKKTFGERHILREDIVKIQGKDCPLSIREVGLEQIIPSWLRRNQPQFQKKKSISDFQLPELSDNTFLLFKSPSPWYFVMAFLANWYRVVIISCMCQLG